MYEDAHLEYAYEDRAVGISDRDYAEEEYFSTRCEHCSEFECSGQCITHVHVCRDCGGDIPCDGPDEGQCPYFDGSCADCHKREDAATPA